MNHKIMLKKIAKSTAFALSLTMSLSLFAANPWQSNQVYHGGDTVSYEGKTYKAQWWTQNEKPDAANQWGVWKEVKDVVNPPVDPPVNPPIDPPVNPPVDPPVTPPVTPPVQTTDAVKLEVTSDWGSGFNYSVVVNNTTDKVLEKWVLEFDYSGDITSAWDVQMTKTGNHYKFTPMAWNNTIAAKGSVKFGGGGAKVGTMTNVKLNGQAVTPPVNPPVDPPVDPPVNPPVDPPVTPPKPGEPLTDAQITALWGGINPEFSAANAVNKMTQLLTKADFEALFPYRHGSKLWNEYNNKNIPEYYTYEGLKEAVAKIANVKYKVETRGDSVWNTRIYRLDKTTKQQLLIAESVDFNAEWNINKPITTQIVDFGSFLSEGSEKDRKRELAAFLANIAHETGGGWATAPGGELAWGLYYNEEVGYSSASVGGYVDGTNKDFPPVAGKSYHGRGPIQLSWNYNYGLMSAILYGDKNILLQSPEKVTDDPVLGYMAAISFWMTPQGTKPSCHDVMSNKWVPTAAQIAKGCTTPCFGVTINVINGGFEAGKGMDDYRVRRRSGHYKDITAKMGVDITGEKLDTLGMQPL